MFSPAEIHQHTLDLCVNGNYLLALAFPWEAPPAARLTPRLCVSSPSAAGGEIFDHCVSDELLPESQITRLIRQTLEGVHHLHQSNLVHLDLKVGLKIIYPCC